jgi:hypothetical protein
LTWFVRFIALTCCVVSVTLWVRSHIVADVATLGIDRADACSHALSAGSATGRLMVTWSARDRSTSAEPAPARPIRLMHTSTRGRGPLVHPVPYQMVTTAGFGLLSGRSSPGDLFRSDWTMIALPWWSLTCVSGLVVWVAFRFVANPARATAGITAEPQPPQTPAPPEDESLSFPEPA